MTQYIGVDIGGTKIAVVHGDDKGEVTKKLRFATPATPQEAIDKIVTAAAQMGPAEAVGVSCGGPLDSERGVILSPPNLPGWDRIEITRILQERLGLPAFLQNDADACALAEWQYGAGRGCRNMIFLTFGTGLGAGLILNGALYAGSCGRAGEVGHIAMEKDGPMGYGKRGSLEGFCSGGGLRQLAMVEAERALAQGKPPAYCPTYGQLGEIDARVVAEAAKAGDETALAVYARCGEMLGRGLAILLDILNPERIVIGSIFLRSRALLYESMMTQLRKEALPDSVAACEILPAALGEGLGDIAALSVAANGMRRN